MKTIAVYFTTSGFESDPFDHPGYRAAYGELARLVAERGARLCIVRGPDTYAGGNAFVRGWEFHDGAFRECGEVKADLVFRKGRFAPDESANVINDALFEDLCTDKSKTYERFAEWCPKTVTVHDAEQLRNALKSIRNRPIVAKPLDREGGHGVIVGGDAEILAGVTEFPYLLQDLIDTDNGIPGITEGRHDLRLTSMAGTPVLCLLRTPKEGSYLANASQGGTLREVPLTDVPEGMMDLFRKVDARLTRYTTRFYSLDAGRHRDGSWKIIELNSQPGLLIHERGEDGERFMPALAEYLLARA